MDTVPSYLTIKEFDSNVIADDGVLMPVADFIDYVDKNPHVAKHGRTGSVVIDGQESNLRVLVFSPWNDYKVEVNRQQLEALVVQGHKVEVVWYSN